MLSEYSRFELKNIDDEYYARVEEDGENITIGFTEVGEEEVYFCKDKYVFEYREEGSTCVLMSVNMDSILVHLSSNGFLSVGVLIEDITSYHYSNALIEEHYHYKGSIFWMNKLNHLYIYPHIELDIDRTVNKILSLTL